MKSYAWIFLSLTPLVLHAQRLTIEDLLNTAVGGRDTGQGVLSPDGKTFASAQRGQIVLHPASGGEDRVLTVPAGGRGEISWSSDSHALAFISDGDVWTVGVAGGDAHRLTHDPAGPGDPRGATDHHPLWRPGGGWILYQSGQHGFNELYAVRTDGSGAHLLAATEIYNGHDVIAANIAPDHGDAVSSDRFDPNPSWSPDGRSIVYTERSRRYFSGRLTVLPFNAETGAAGAPRVIYTATNDPGGAWAVNTATWLADSRSLVVVLQESGWDKLWRIDAHGGKPHPITTGTGEDEEPVVSPDGKLVAFLSNRDFAEERHLYVVPVMGGTPHRVTRTPGIDGPPQWTPDSKSLYVTHRTLLGGASLLLADATGASEPKSISTAPANKLASAGITPEVVRFPSTSGFTIAGILYKPADFDPSRRYPTVISVHGGPEGQTTLTLSPWPVFLADHGYVVLEPNFRGSTGYGEHFRNSNVEDSGGGEIDDIAASVKYLVDAGITDPQRVAISGGSHGGTVVANAVAKLPGTFAAGIEMFGVVDRALFLQYTNRNSAIRWQTKMGGTPDEKPAVYRKANVLLEVNAIRTPLLLLHGEEDPQVPPQESQQFAAALKAAGKTFDYHTYPHEGHGFQDREHRRDAYERQLGFLALYLLPKSSVATTAAAP